MDLILWRHAEAEELAPEVWDAQTDLARTLTLRGHKQAERMGSWLDRQLPGSTRILVSPAKRCEQTALALGRKFKIREELAPDATPAQLLELVQWPLSKAPILVIGHQPSLGQVISQLLGMTHSECSVRKGAVWWLKARDRESQSQTIVVTVQSPERL